MKAVYIISFCVVVALVGLTNAQIPMAGLAAPVIPPVFPPMLGMGLGMGMLGFPFFGPFGFPFFGGLGFGRLGLGLGLGFGRFGLRGKRDLNATLPGSEVRCIISTTNNTIMCSLGVEKNIGCQMETRLTEIPKLKVNLVDLEVLEHVEGNIEFLNLVSTKNHGKLAQFLTKNNLPAGTFTFIHPSTLKPILLAVYGDATLGVPGFLVKDQLCYSSLVSVIKTNIGRVRTNLIIA